MHRDMYRGPRAWTMRQFAGMGNARNTKRALQVPARAWQTGLSTAFDLPTLRAATSTTRSSLGEVGKWRVAISSLEDMKVHVRRDHLGESARA